MEKHKRLKEKKAFVFGLPLKILLPEKKFSHVTTKVVENKFS